MKPRLPYRWLVAALLSLPAPAAAVSRFPPEIASHLGLDYTPPCGLCHIHGTTGPGSVATPFGISMLARGLSSDRSTLIPALDSLSADQVDSDGDGVTDSDELLANTDPNTPANVPLVGSDPTYGCAAAPGSASGAAGAAGLLLLGTALITLVRVSNRRRRDR